MRIFRLLTCVVCDAALTAVSLGFYPVIANSEGDGTLVQKELRHQREVEIIKTLADGLKEKSGEKSDRRTVAEQS